MTRLGRAVILQLHAWRPMGDDISSLTGSFEALGARANEVSMNVRTVSSMVLGVAQSLERSAKELGSFEATVSTAKRSSGELAHRATHLGEATNEVERMLAVIEDVATQTRFLSVNATIEAARAGERGAGFVVVAQSVKSLAAQANTAVADIRNSMARIISAIAPMVAHGNELTGLLEKVRSGAQEFSTHINEQAQVSRAVVGFVDEASHTVDGIAERLTAGGSSARAPSTAVPQQENDSAPHAME